MEKEKYVLEKNHNGQKTITTTWVLTKEVIFGKKKDKARLLAWGFEEGSFEIVKDCPICGKESLNLVLTIMDLIKWTSIDIKLTFLQRKEIDEVVYLYSPFEPPLFLDISIMTCKVCLPKISKKCNWNTYGKWSLLVQKMLKYLNIWHWIILNNSE